MNKRLLLNAQCYYLLFHADKGRTSWPMLCMLHHTYISLSSPHPPHLDRIGWVVPQRGIRLGWWILTVKSLPSISMLACWRLYHWNWTLTIHLPPSTSGQGRIVRLTAKVTYIYVYMYIGVNSWALILRGPPCWALTSPRPLVGECEWHLWWSKESVKEMLLTRTAVQAVPHNLLICVICRLTDCAAQSAGCAKDRTASALQLDTCTHSCLGWNWPSGWDDPLTIHP